MEMILHINNTYNCMSDISANTFISDNPLLSNAAT